MCLHNIVISVTITMRALEPEQRFEYTYLGSTISARESSAWGNCLDSEEIQRNRLLTWTILYNGIFILFEAMFVRMKMVRQCSK